jgi:hypothetical protein
LDQSAISVSFEEVQRFCRRNHVSKMAIFGSVLRSDFRPDSDVDVLVVFEPNTRVSFMTLGRMKRELEAIFHRPVDLVPQDGLKPTIRDEVLSTAHVIYAT